MPHDNESAFLQRLYRTGQISIDEHGVVTPQIATPRRNHERYWPWMQEPMARDRVSHEAAVAALKRLRAKELIRRVWQDEGGPGSGVGLPIGGQVSVAEAGDGWTSDFRSGSISLQSNQCVVKKNTVMTVDFVGIECNVRQEGTDELYGVVGLLGPANSVTTSNAFPGGDGVLKLGPEGMRFWTTQRRLYSGPIEDVVIVGTLIEHDDFADVEAVAREIADKIAETAGQLVGALTGVPAEAASDQTWFRDSLAAGIGFVMGDIFGMGDDPYDAQVIRIPWDDVLAGAVTRQQPRTRPDDPKTIANWTHRLKLTGRDDGGDLGDYDLYFDVAVTPVEESRNCPIPATP